MTEQEFRLSSERSDVQTDSLARMGVKMHQSNAQETDSAQAMQSKFAQAEGTFELSFANLNIFFAGLEGLIGERIFLIFCSIYA